MTNSNSYSFNYTFGDAQYSVTDTEEVHSRLQSDADFMSQYFANSTTVPELISIIDETTDNTCPESVPKSFTWTKQATKLFLNSYLDRKESFRNPKIKKKSLWGEILEIMMQNNYTKNEDLLDRKMRNMKKSYKNIKDNNKKSSTSRGRVSWEYFDTFEEIFVNDMTINNCATVSLMQTDNNTTTANESIKENHKLNHPLPNPEPSSLDISASSSQNITPSLESQPSSEKSTRMSSLYNLRKKQIDIEERRIKAIIDLKTTIEQSNIIQKERNDLLRNLLLLRTRQIEAEENI